MSVRPSTLRLGAFALVATLGLAGCGAVEELFGPGDNVGGDQDLVDPPVGAPPAPGGGADEGPTVTDGQGQEARLVRPEPGTDGPRERPFETHTVSDDGRTVTLFFWSGVEPCNVLDRVDVTEDADRVTFTLVEGSQPSDGEQMACIEIAVYKAVEVPLQAPLDGREIIDGAAA